MSDLTLVAQAIDRLTLAFITVEQLSLAQQCDAPPADPGVTPESLRLQRIRQTQSSLRNIRALIPGGPT